MEHSQERSHKFDNSKVFVVLVVVRRQSRCRGRRPPPSEGPEVGRGDLRPRKCQSARTSEKARTTVRVAPCCREVLQAGPDRSVERQEYLKAVCADVVQRRGQGRGHQIYMSRCAPERGRCAVHIKIWPRMRSRRQDGAAGGTYEVVSRRGQ